LVGFPTGRLTQVKYLPDLLIRARSTPSQGEFGPLGRRRNVAAAFRVHPRYLGVVEGKRIVLVDDVHTTGATIEECAKVLNRAHVAQIDVLTLARVVRVDGQV
jgi:predicted amidophosphoribosyltransferase